MISMQTEARCGCISLLSLLHFLLGHNCCFSNVVESLYFGIRQCLIPGEGFMDIIGALKQEESKPQRQLTAVRGAIAVLNGGARTVISPRRTSSSNGSGGKKTMSAAVRAKIARLAKARWAKIRAEKAKKAK
jgi:hypothetical protein